VFNVLEKSTKMLREKKKEEKEAKRGGIEK